MKNRFFDIEGSLIIVTGGNSGIGREAARKLSSSGGRVIIACRNREKAEEAASEISIESGNPVGSMHLDLSRLDSIRIFTEKFLEVYGTPDVLVNNAGVYMRKFTKTGFGMETTLAVNYLGPFYLSNLLLPHMARIEDETRIVNVTSDSYYVKAFDTNLTPEKKHHGFSAYSRSKRALMYFSFKLAEKLSDTGITVNCVNPGHASTNIWPSDALHWKIAGGIANIFSDPPSYAAENVTYAASSPELIGVSGEYISNLKTTPVREGAFDDETSSELWEKTLDYLGKLI